MKVLIHLVLLLSFSLYAKNFTVASYNVENLFDLIYNKTEYKEYIPNTKTWNKIAFNNKLNNISYTINELNADIIALQEIESKEALDTLLKKTKYKYSSFLKKQTNSVGVAILSKFPIISTKKIEVDNFDTHSRDILKATINIKNKPLIIYVNHWRSKRASESSRIIYATKLKKEIDKLAKNSDYIILGDLNSNYNEYETFKYNDKLNDTSNITGINQILNTTINGNYILKNTINSFNQNVHYNLWLEILKKNRFSNKFKNRNSTPDHIIISSGLLDNQNISYVDNSFKVFKPNYLYKNNKIIRWNYRLKNGYSDHLPIYASFSTKKQNYSFKSIKKPKENTISYLYDIQRVNDYDLQNVIVIYKSKKIAIISKDNDRSIMIFKPPKNLEVGHIYDMKVDSIDTYNGLKEIKKISNINKKAYFFKYKDYYLDGNTIDLKDEKYQNNIIKNLSGIYKKGYLYYKNNKKIKLYFHKKQKRPQNGKKLTINCGHLSTYKSKIQIVLYDKKDFTVQNQDI